MSQATPGDGRGGPQAQTVARVAQVARWLVDGNGTAEVYRLSRDAWQLSTRQTDRLIAMARQEITDAWQLERAQMVSMLLSRSDAVFRLAMEQANTGAAIAAIATAAKLAKL